MKVVLHLLLLLLSLADEDNLDAESAEILKEWEEHMSDFEAADLITFVLPSRKEEVFFEEISKTPSSVRGAWFVASGENDLVDFTI